MSRDLVIVLGTDDRWLTRGLGQAQGKVKTFAQKASQDINKAMHGAIRGLTNVAGLGMVGLLAAEAKKVLEFETRLTRLGVAGRATAAQVGMLREQIFKTAEATGQDAGSLLGGMEKFVALTGKIDEGSASLETFAAVATATGANVEDIATTAAAMSTNMHVAGSEMHDVFGMLLAQGKSGAIELKDLASIVQGLTPQFATFGLKGKAGMEELSAELQVVREGFGSGAEAATGMASLMTAISKKAADGKLQKYGINPFKKGTHELRDLRDIIFELTDKFKDNKPLLEKVLGRQEAYQALLPFFDKGREKMDALIESGKKGGAELTRDLATMAETPAMKIARAKQHLDHVFNDFLAKNLDKIAEAMKKVVAVLEWMLNHKAETLAIFGLLRGGGALGGYAGGLAGLVGGGTGGGGMAGALGAYGGMRGRGAPGGRAASLLGNAGNIMMGASVGVALASTIGHDLPEFSRGALVAANALAGLPGPIGMFAKAMAVAGDGIVAGFAAAEARIDAKADALAKSTIGDWFFDRGKEMGIGKRAFGQGTDVTFDRTAGAGGAVEVDANKRVIDEMINQGVIKKGGYAGNSVYGLDEGAMAKFLDSQPDLKGNKEGRARAEAIIRQAYGNLQGGEDHLDIYGHKTHSNAVREAVDRAQFGTGGVSLAQTVAAAMRMPVVPADVQVESPTGGTGRAMGHESARAEQLVRVIVSAENGFSIKIANDVTQRKRPAP